MLGFRRPNAVEEDKDNRRTLNFSAWSIRRTWALQSHPRLLRFAPMINTRRINRVRDNVRA